MIKKNDCVPKKVLNQRKLRRQALAVMIGGLVIAFLLGLVVGWFIPKNDKKNITTSAEVLVPDTNPETSFYPVVGQYKFAPIFSFVSFSMSRSAPSVTVYTLFLQVNTDTKTLGGSFGYRSVNIINDNTMGQVSGYTFYRIPFDFEGPITRAQLIAEGGINTSSVLSYSKGDSGINNYAVASQIPHRVHLNLNRLTYYFDNNGQNVSTPSFSLEAGAVQRVYYFFDTLSPMVPVSSNSSFDSQLIPLYVTSDGTSFNPNLVYTRLEYLNYGSTQFTLGKNDGYNAGYAAGVAAGGNNNFMSLITAVIDAPITAFTSLFDFEILGYNMKDLALALLTAALLVAAIRFFSRL